MIEQRPSAPDHEVDQPNGAGSRQMARAQASSRTRSRYLERYAGVLVLVLIIGVFSIAAPGTFLTYSNIVGVLGNQGISGIIALGLVVPLAAGVFDISIDGLMTLSVVSVTDLFQATNGKCPIAVAVLIVLVGAVLVGLLNSFIVLQLGVDPFIGTIAVSSILIGISQMIANGTVITNNIPASFTNFGRLVVLKIPIEVFICVAIAALLWYLLTFTPFGPALYATGAAREASRLAGIRTKRTITIAFCCSAVGAAIAGVLYAALNGSGPPSVGDGYLLGSYATVFLGSTMIRPGRFNIVGVLVALLILAFGVNGLELVGLPFWITETFQGVALLIAVVLGRARALRSGLVRRRPGGSGPWRSQALLAAAVGRPDSSSDAPPPDQP